MSENATTNMNEKDKKPERATHIGDQDNESFPAFIIAVFLLACIWMLAGFTVFKYTIVIVFMAKFVEIMNSNSTTNNNETNTSSLSQVCMKCSSRMNNDTISHSSSTMYDPVTINMRGQFTLQKKNK